MFLFEKLPGFSTGDRVTRISSHSQAESPGKSSSPQRTKAIWFGSTFPEAVSEYVKLPGEFMFMISTFLGFCFQVGLLSSETSYNTGRGFGSPVDVFLWWFHVQVEWWLSGYLVFLEKKTGSYPPVTWTWILHEFHMGMGLVNCWLCGRYNMIWSYNIHRVNLHQQMHIEKIHDNPCFISI